MIQDNLITLQGVLTRIEKTDNINSMPFCGYEATVLTERNSGVTDEAIVIIRDGLNVDNIRVNNAVLVTGAMQTVKNYITGKVLVFVYALDIREHIGEHWEYENEVRIHGQLSKNIKYRETPAGKRITDISLKVKSEIKLNDCFIPCICWQENADMVSKWNAGEKVVIKGRLQSRQYIKRIDEKTEETRTAYEVSISAIQKE